MFRRSSLLKQSDLTRYAKGLRAAGIEEWRIDVAPDGTHSIVVTPQKKPVGEVNDWENS